MSSYKITQLKDHRVINYRFSVDSKEDPEYIKLKETVREHNEAQRQREAAGLEPHYLRVRGRGRNPIKSGGNHDHVVDSNAQYFDVYVQRDTDAMHRYRQRAASQKAKGFLTTSVSKLAQVINPVRVA